MERGKDSEGTVMVEKNWREIVRTSNELRWLRPGMCLVKSRFQLESRLGKTGIILGTRTRVVVEYK